MSLRCEGSAVGFDNVPCPSPHGSVPTFLSQGDLMLCRGCAKLRFPENGNSDTDTVPKEPIDANEHIDDNEATSMAVRTFTLTDIAGWHIDQCADLFIDNLVKIFNYDASAINGVLNKMSLTAVNKIRNVLVAKAMVTFPQYKDHKVPQRNVVHTAAKDIWTIGFSITNGATTRDTSKLFNKDRGLNGDMEVDLEAVSQMQKLIDQMQKLSSKLISMENALADVKAENEELKENMSILKSEILVIKDTSPVPVPPDSSSHTAGDDTACDDIEVPRKQIKKAARKQKLARSATNNGVNQSAGTMGTSQTNNDNQMQSPTSDIRAPELRATEPPRQAHNNKLISATSGTRTPELRAADPPRQTPINNVQIFISRAHPNTTTTQIQHHLNNMGIAECEVQDLTRHSEQSTTWKSYKATLPSSMKDSVLRLDNWPKGMRIRLFHPRRSNQPFRGSRSYSQALQAAPRRDDYRQQSHDTSQRTQHQEERHHNGRYNHYGERHDEQHSNGRYRHEGGRHGEQHHSRRSYSQRERSYYSR